MFNIPSFFGFRAGGGVGILPFQFTINTNNTSVGSSTSTQFKLPLVSSLPLNAVVDWGDSTTDTITTFNQAQTLHTYASSGTYTIKITGDLSGWRFNNSGDRLKMLNVVTWGALNISVDNGFNGCTNLTCSATDAPVISTTSLSNCFRSCSNFNGAIGNWNLSSVTNTNAMFFAASAFNQNIGSWNVSNVTNFGFMFGNSTAFNNGGSSDINNWNLKTTGTLEMGFMFFSAFNFNQNIGSWNTSAVTNMSSMFQSAIAFNQNIGSWNVANVTSFTNFMASKTNLNYSAANLNAIYNGWSASGVQPNITITFGSIKYTAAGQAGKNVLTNAPNNWTITDGGI